MRPKNENMERISIKLNSDVKQWYCDKSAVYGMPMAVYMQFILTQFCESQQNNEAVRNLSFMNSDGDLKDVNKTLLDLLTLISEQQEKALNAVGDKEPQSG